MQYSQQFYGEFDYQAKSWDRPRRVIVQVRRKAGELIPDYLFLVTNMETRPEMVVSIYTLNAGRWKTISKSVKMDLEWIKSVISTG